MTARIVFVDDCANDVFLAQYLLTRAGICSEAHLVQNQGAQQRVLLSWTPHLIVADFRLSHTDGWTAFITARTFAPGVPFIFRSRKISGKRARQAYERGALACVLKRETDSFVTLVRAVMAHSLVSHSKAEAFRAALTQRLETEAPGFA